MLFSAVSSVKIPYDMEFSIDEGVKLQCGRHRLPAEIDHLYDITSVLNFEDLRWIEKHLNITVYDFVNYIPVIVCEPNMSPRMFRDRSDAFFATYLMLSNSVNSLKFRMKRIRDRLTHTESHNNYIIDHTVKIHPTFSRKYSERCVTHKLICTPNNLLSLFSDFNTTIQSLSSVFVDLSAIESALNDTIGLSSFYSTTSRNPYHNVAQFQTTQNSCNIKRFQDTEAYEVAYRTHAMSRWLIRIKDRLSFRIANIRDTLDPTIS
jgi:hypothetical protein